MTLIDRFSKASKGMAGIVSGAPLAGELLGTRGLSSGLSELEDMVKGVGMGGLENLF